MKYLILFSLFFGTTFPVFASSNTCIGRSLALKIIKSNLFELWLKDSSVPAKYEFIYEVLTNEENIQYFKKTYYSSFDDIDTWSTYEASVNCAGNFEIQIYGIGGD